MASLGARMVTLHGDLFRAIAERDEAAAAVALDALIVHTEALTNVTVSADC